METLPKLEKQFIAKLVQEPITEFSIKKGSEKGDNVAGEIYSIKILTVSNKNLNLIYKILPSHNPMVREYATKNFIFGLEIDMYTTIANKVKELLKVQLPIPKYYDGLCDGLNDYLILEDERPNGYEMANKYIGLNFDEVELIFKELASFHAATYYLIKHEGEQFFKTTTEIERYVKGFWNEDSLENLMQSQGLYGVAFDVAMKFLDENLKQKVLNKIEKAKIGLIARQISNLTDVKIFPVIVHGDFWTNNILFKYEQNTKKPLQTKFIDFQQARRGNIYEDLLYFVFTSTTRSFRKEHLVQLLDIYFDALMLNISKIPNCPTPYNFSKGRFIDLFYECYIPMYIYMTFAIPLQLGVPEPESNEPTTTGNNTGSSTNNNPGEDEGVHEQNPFWEFSSNLEKLYLSHPMAVQRLEEMTQEFVELGIF